MSLWENLNGTRRLEEGKKHSAWLFVWKWGPGYRGWAKSLFKRVGLIGSGRRGSRQPQNT